MIITYPHFFQPHKSQQLEVALQSTHHLFSVISNLQQTDRHKQSPAKVSLNHEILLYQSLLQHQIHCLFNQPSTNKPLFQTHNILPTNTPQPNHSHKKRNMVWKHRPSVDIFTWTWNVWDGRTEHTSKEQKMATFDRNCSVKTTLRLF